MIGAITYADLVREVTVTLAGFVLGVCTYLSILYWRSYHRTKERMSLVMVWVMATFAFVAAFQGFVRAVLIVTDQPLDYRDWATIFLNVNALALVLIIAKIDPRLGKP